MSQSDGPRTRGLERRLFWFGFAATFLTAVVVSLLTLHATYGFVRGQLHTRYPVLLESAEERLTPWLTEREAELLQIGRRIESSCAAGLEHTCVWQTLSTSGGRSGLARLLKQEARASQGFAGFLLLDPEQRVLAGAGQDLRPVLAPDAWNSSQEGLDAVTWAVEPGQRAVVSVPLAGGASLHGGLAPETVRPLLDRPGLRGEATVYLLDSAAQIVAASAAFQLARAPGPRSLERSVLGGARDYENDSGVRVMGSRLPLQRHGWQLLLEEPVVAAFAPLLAVARRVLLADLLVIVAVCLLARRITVAVVRPIQALSEGARRLSRGDLDVEIPGEQRTDELGVLIRSFNDMSRTVLSGRQEVETANAELKRRNQELQGANEVLEQLSITDGLTKLHNHRFFQDYLTREIKRVRRSGDPLSMLLLDIDDFKRVNDRLGHAAGDQLLADMARLLNDALRESDLVARYGGEEFVVVTSSTPLEGALRVAENVRRAVAEASFIIDDSMRIVKVTVSLGVAQYKGDRKAFFLNADRALYQAKSDGKNRVVSENELPG